MFASRHSGTVIAKGLKIVGIVAAEGLVEVNGQIEGELRCSSLVIARGAHVTGTIAAERVVVDGKVEGPIHGGEVLLKSQAYVVGDIHHKSLAIEKGASLRAARCKLDKKLSASLRRLIASAASRSQTRARRRIQWSVDQSD